MKKFEEITKLVINVDMVNGFVKEGAMADRYIEHIIPEHKKIMKQIVNEQEGLAIIKDTHKKDCIEFNRFPVHCVEGTEEAELIKELKEFEPSAIVYKKNSTSTMFAPKFIENIEEMEKLEKVIIIGCCTDICILNLAIPLKNYFDQKDKNIEIIVPKNAVETYNSDIHNRDEYNEMAFKLMKQAGVNLVETI